MYKSEFENLEFTINYPFTLHCVDKWLADCRVSKLTSKKGGIKC